MVWLCLGIRDKARRDVETVHGQIRGHWTSQAREKEAGGVQSSVFPVRYGSVYYGYY